MTAKVTFLPEGKTIEVKKNISILDAARQAGVLIESPCGGVGTCGKCRVKIKPGFYKNIKFGKNSHLSLKDKKEGFVLSCETFIMGDIIVDVPQTKNNREIKIVDHGKSFNIIFDNYITKKYFKDENITQVFADGILIAKETADTKNKNYGLAIDIGTTTLVVSLVDVNTGNEIDSVSSLNPQSSYAQDVLSRIRFASDNDGLSTMFDLVLENFNNSINEICRKNNVDKKYIYEAVFSGNTTMIHLATKTNPSSLGKYPYTPVIKGGDYVQSKSLGLNISEFGLVYLPPIMSAYVGADITSGILASELFNEKGIVLFVDIGTNGEMVLAKNGKLIATSTAAGPAFEGMNISHGMRAGDGAIERFDIHNETINIETIGDSLPQGICGSGLLDIVGEFVANNIINKSGKFKENVLFNNNLAIVENAKLFRIYEDVSISQKDIRQVQLAKGAVRAGIEALLKAMDIEKENVDKVLIAGSFGYHLSPKSLINIGLLPKEFDGKIEFLGNTSKSGGIAFLLNKTYRKNMKKITQNIEVLELANIKDFEKIFVKELSFELAEN
jgi:uncharacterized 2Fe-2S/4Fe-4S cluster protein (DUF4445 family)